MLTLIVLMGVLLRFLGLHWSLPNSDHIFTYHPDEQSIVLSALGIDPSRGQWNPYFYGYGSLLTYATYLVYFTADLLGIWDLGSPLLLKEMFDPRFREAFFLARLLSFFAGVLTIPLGFYLAKKWFGKSEALIASLLISICPLLVYLSHFATSDSVFTFFCLLSLIFMTRFGERKDKKEVILMGVVIGITIGVKYTGLLLFFPAFILILFHFLSLKKTNPNTIKKTLAFTLLFFVSSLAGFLFVMPHALLDWTHFSQKFLIEFLTFSKLGRQTVFEGTGNGWVYLFFHNLPVALGWPLWGITLLSLFWFIKNPKKSLLPLLLSYLGIFILILGTSKTRYLRYLLPLCPIFCILTGYFIHGVWKRIKERTWLKGLAILVFSIMILHTALYSWAKTNLFTLEDSRDSALKWIRTNVEPGVKIGFIDYSLAFSPPVFPFNGRIVNRKINGKWMNRYFFNQKTSRAPYEMVLLGLNTKRLMENKPDYVVISSFDIREHLRLKKKKTLNFWNELNRNYVLVAKPWHLEPQSLGFSFSWNFPPHDWHYVNPIIFIYQRRG